MDVYREVVTLEDSLSDYPYLNSEQILSTLKNNTMFKFDLKQSGFLPEGNNYCGGFALAAALNFARQAQTNMPDPILVYNQIQREQVDLEADVKELIQFSEVDGNGTAICLPSSIARVAKKYGYQPVIYYNHKLNWQLSRIMTSEQRRFGRVEFNPAPSLYDTLTKLTQHNCFVILVGNHWVAVGRNRNGKIHGYDSAEKFATGEVEITGNDLSAYADEYAGVVIAF